jgi:hypothetical protein
MNINNTSRAEIEAFAFCAKICSELEYADLPEALCSPEISRETREAVRDWLKSRINVANKYARHRGNVLLAKSLA